MIAQKASTFADKQANLRQIDTLAHAGSALSVDVLVFPELFLTGYHLNQSQLRMLAEPLDGPSINRLQAIAKSAKVAIICGFAEVAEGQFYNSAVVISASGQCMHHYRKVFLFGDAEKALFSPGDRLPTFTLNGICCGLSICYDIEFAEVTRHFSRQGASLIFNPTANMQPYTNVPLTLVRARALENGIAIVYANLAGQEGSLCYTGQSAIVGPDGQDIVRAGEDAALLIADVAKALQRQKDHPQSSQLNDLSHHPYDVFHTKIS
ncbi:carbon-nitrogen hydrolase family protein [Celerinatantimonas yamalensis]|uniref:Carbon-nitrogen hydrolase family protein n=1 Tax=Celerinatantimonas yamalensis TaxID=559956 RepID=A0ABW9GCI7_9GAMM